MSNNIKTLINKAIIASKQAFIPDGSYQMWCSLAFFKWEPIDLAIVRAKVKEVKVFQMSVQQLFVNDIYLLFMWSPLVTSSDYFAVLKKALKKLNKYILTNFDTTWIKTTLQ